MCEQCSGIRELNQIISCRRLSLTCLCYLWQRSQQELLAEMIEAGMHSILIKVAGIGLEVKHLGKTLAEMQGTLVNLVGSRFPISINPDSIVEQLVRLPYLRRRGRI